MNSCATLSPVVRAKAGTHNHRFLLGPQASAKVPQERLPRAAKTMTDQAVASQLRALADDYQRRAEKASHVDAAKAFARSTATTGRE
jgi:hypothetical protein